MDDSFILYILVCALEMITRPTKALGDITILRSDHQGLEVD